MKITPLGQLGLLLPVAVLIWLAIFSLSYHSFVLDVPVEIIGLPNNLAIVQDITTLPVTVRAKNIAYYQLRTSRPAKAILDVSFIQTTGNYNVKPKVELMASDVWLVSYQPEIMPVEVVLAVSAPVAIAADVKGFPANGYALNEIGIAPLEVQMIGPDRLVNTIQQAYVVIDVTKKQTSFVAKGSPEVRDAGGHKLSNIRFQPNEVNVSVTIVKGETFKTVGLAPVFSGSLPAGYWISEVQFDPPTITIKSSVNRLEGVNSIKTTPINLSNRTGDFSDEVGLDIPAGVSLVGDKLVKATVKLGSSPFNRRLVLVPNCVNVAPGLKVASVSPSTVNVMLSGPSEKLDTLDQTKPRLEVDVRSGTSGDNIFQLSKDMFKVPEGVEVINFEPASINVALTKTQ